MFKFCFDNLKYSPLSTKYNYASTKKWTWKRSKLTEGQEMIHEGLLEVKVRNLESVFQLHNSGSGILHHQLF